MKRASATTAFLLCAATSAHAGLFDDLSKVADTVKKGASLLPGPAGTASTTSTGAGGMSSEHQPSGTNVLLPLDLTAFPRAQLYRRVDNPFDRVKLPISVPVKTPDGFVPPYSVPMEGKVTMLQFAHRSDDSPLLIRAHYEAWLAQQGFERLLVCETPCPQLPSQWDWRKVIDPTERLDSNYVPDQPTYVAGYKQDAMVLVGIGKHIYDYTSVVKIVEGRVLDPQPWKTVTAPKAPLAPVALSKPAAAAAVVGAVPSGAEAAPSASKAWYDQGTGWNWDVIPAGTRLRLLEHMNVQPQLYPQVGAKSAKAVLRHGDEAVFSGEPQRNGLVHVMTKAGDGWVDYRTLEPLDAEKYKNRTASGTAVLQSATKVETVSPDQLAERLAQIKGIAVVQFSSTDKGCPFCVQSNPRFETLAQAQAKGSNVTFLRVMWQPYTQAFDDRLAIQYGLVGLPTFLAFKNGRAVHRINGNRTAVELHNGLLADLK
ncbi:thioredoxin family protein [Noviherbaspirillum sp.]|jgi:thiol-disulfide isomerase/thioredoxin|uniref:thioredoxin family protein n=1 Tax=Noviherbaspirillum sp. TaxID=1926288 RepID=UPI0025EB68FA|nr:thioredoxin family protein [Noviherbaspirillum sp.]